MELIASEDLRALEHEYSLLRLVHHRNKNQHRVTIWWKHLNTLKRNLTKFLSLIHTFQTQKKEKIRDQALRTAHLIKKHSIKKCYRAFNGIVALGQFITLAFVLIGLLGKIDSCINKIHGLEEVPTEKQNVSMNRSTEVLTEAFAQDLGEELGEEIGEETENKVISSPQNIDLKKRKSASPKEERSLKKKKKVPDTSDGSKKRKKKKKKSAIDDIFG